MFLNNIGPLGWIVILVAAYWKRILLVGGAAGGLIALWMRLAG